jgi:hypothetical protein
VFNEQHFEEETRGSALLDGASLNRELVHSEQVRTSDRRVEQFIHDQYVYVQNENF